MTRQRLILLATIASLVMAVTARPWSPLAYLGTIAFIGLGMWFAAGTRYVSDIDDAVVREVQSRYVRGDKL